MEVKVCVTDICMARAGLLSFHSVLWCTLMEGLNSSTQVHVERKFTNRHLLPTHCFH